MRVQSGLKQANKWFNKELNNLIHNREWRKKARMERQETFKFLRSLDFVTRFFTSGSFGRKTFLPGSDIDIFVEINNNIIDDVLAAHKEIYKELQRKYPRNSERLQPHTVGLILNEIKFEFIPTIKENEKYYIPEKTNKIETDPYGVKNLVKTANRNSNGAFSRHVRIFKFWKKQNDINIPSFYIELSVLEIFKDNTFRHSLTDFSNIFKLLIPKIKAGRLPNHFTGKLSFQNEERSRINKILDQSYELITGDITQSSLINFFNL